jgi:hypothetical protein
MIRKWIYSIFVIGLFVLPVRAEETQAEKAPAKTGEPTGEACQGVVAAHVNRQPIFLGEILQRTQPMEDNLVLMKPGYSRNDMIKEIRNRELDRLITMRLFSLAAHADESVQPSTAEVEGHYQGLVQRFGGEEQVTRFYAKSVPEIKDGIFVSLAVDQLKNKNVINRIEITPKLKEEFYQKHLKDMFTIPAQVAVRGLFRFAEDEVEAASEAQKIQAIRKEMEEALQGLTTKEERLNAFSQFVQAYSEHEPTRFSGGYWYIYAGHMIQPKFWRFEDAVVDAPVNVLSDVVELDDGYCLFIVDYKRPELVKSYSESEQEIERVMQKEQYERYQKEWMDSLKERFDVKIHEDALLCGVPKEEEENQAAESESESVEKEED